MSEFTDSYVDLLIKQYWEQPNARAEIEAQAATWETIRDGIASFYNAFDLDQAIGAQLDIIGKIVGINRVVPFVLAKFLFGFADNPNAGTFDTKFGTVSGSAPFASKFEPTRTDLELNDADYRFFIKAKIAVNVGSAFMASDTKVTMQDVIFAAFNGDAYIIDNKDMSLDLYVSPAVSTERLLAIQQLNLLPKPQGVRYAQIILAAPGETFGFSNNPNALAFASKFDASQVGGRFASKVIDI